MRPVCKADNLTTFMCRLSRNLGASTSWNAQGLSRPVMESHFIRVFTYCNGMLSNTQLKPGWVRQFSPPKLSSTREISLFLKASRPALYPS
jgi:hypothetical protein